MGEFAVERSSGRKEYEVWSVVKIVEQAQTECGAECEDEHQFLQ